MEHAMVHRAGNLLVCAGAIVSAAVLAVTSAVIDSSVVPVTSANGVQVVRGYYSALNEYLLSGRQELMQDYLQELPPSEAGAMPRTTDRLGASVELAALQASYPQLRYRLVAIDGGVDALVAGVALDHASRRFPEWINLASEGVAPQASIHVRIIEGAIGATASNPGGLPAYVAMVETGAQFRAETSGRITIADLRITGSATSTKQLPLLGPGVFIVQSGSLTVIGDGLAEIATLSTAERISVPAGVERVARTGDAIIVPFSSTVVQIDGSTEATILAAMMVPIETEPDRYSEREHLDQSRMSLGLLDLLRELPEGVQPIWFGTAEVLSGQPEVTEPGWMSLEAGWLVVPIGKEHVLGAEGRQMVLYAEADGLVIDASSQGETKVTNEGSETALVLVARVGDGKGSGSIGGPEA
jgi:hypothetical protein